MTSTDLSCGECGTDRKPKSITVARGCRRMRCAGVGCGQHTLSYVTFFPFSARDRISAALWRFPLLSYILRNFSS
ncbi:hypothetical protein Aduo_008484 [Ancylostoma duodenale]